MSSLKLQSLSTGTQELTDIKTQITPEYPKIPDKSSGTPTSPSRTTLLEFLERHEMNMLCLQYT